MKRLIQTLSFAALAVLVLAPAARADFGLNGLDVTLTDAGGKPAMQAGSHPFEFTTTVNVNDDGTLPEGGPVRNLTVELPPGLAVNAQATPTCTAADFAAVDTNLKTLCPDAAAVGVAGARGTAAIAETTDFGPIYNLVPPPGVAAKLGFHVLGFSVVVEGGVRSEGDYRIYSLTPSISQVEPIFGAQVKLWGNPASQVHDSLRGRCLTGGGVSAGSCPVNIPEVAFVTLPTSCPGPLQTIFKATSWLGAHDEGAAFTHDDSEPPSPLGTLDCAKLPFHPSIDAEPTSKAARSPSGLDFSLDVQDEGLLSPSGTAAAHIKQTEVTLPEGFSVNPAVAEGLEVCTPGQLAKETAFSLPGAGCPNASKIGSVEVKTPLLKESLEGSLFQAAPYDNPFGSLIALYVVIKNADRGILVKQPLRVKSDPVTGQLTTIAEDMPQLPFTSFRLHFREGTRSPLATPPACGTYEVKALLTPWSGRAPSPAASDFQVISGPDGNPCPKGGLPPFKPGITAGTTNNAAGRFSPFYLRLHRSDSEQEITHFSIKLPPGITGKLAGIPYCPDAAIAAAKARSGPHGGQEELDSPSCPAASEIGRSLAGSGVGPSPAYAAGKIYLAGPYNGSPLSIVAITAAKVGPFDLGTVVVREAFKIDPETAEVFIDSTGSDPIPHIIQGIPVHLRDIRAYVDKPNFVLNPTDCTRTSTASTLLGAGLDFGSTADDNPVTVSTPFQAADCAALPFKPKLGLRLLGGTKRGDHPAFRARLKMNGIGEAGIARAQVTLPRSEFIENAHFKTICTRVQFKAGAGNGAECPANSVYGKARATTPILGEPLEGPVFLRSSEHQLPDLVVALSNSQVNVNLIGKVDSVKGRLRNTFEAAPDAPVSEFVLSMQGGKKGLFVNSVNLCKAPHRAEMSFTGQNGKAFNARPALQAKCGKGSSGRRRQ